MPADTAQAGLARGLRIFSRPNDDPGKILAVAITLCLVCSMLVASAAVLLKPQQDRNQALAIRKQIVRVAGYQADDAQQVEALFRQHVEARILNLDTGDFDDSIDPASFDMRAAARNPATSRALAPQRGSREDQAASQPGTGLPGTGWRAHQDRHPAGLRLRPVVNAVRFPGTRRRWQDHHRPDLLRTRGNTGSG